MLVLASASPRRQELLRNAAISFTVQPADIDESLRTDESPVEYTKRLAREKALKVFQLRPNDFVLAADTIVVAGHEILGKPRDGDDAARMLRLLSGRTHQVTTGVCLMGPEKEAHVASETTLVTMSAISEDEIRAYIATGEPMDKAGAYAIQGIASRWIPRIEGDYSNVVGLPVALVYRMLGDCGAICGSL
jgi:septum formation protein